MNVTTLKKGNLKMVTSKLIQVKNSISHHRVNKIHFYGLNRVKIALEGTGCRLPLFTVYKVIITCGKTWDIFRPEFPSWRHIRANMANAINAASVWYIFFV